MRVAMTSEVMAHRTRAVYSFVHGRDTHERRQRGCHAPDLARAPQAQPAGTVEPFRCVQSTCEPGGDRQARPSVDLLLHLAEQLDLPLRERNRVLLAGGYAPRYEARDRDDASVAAVMDGLRGLLDAHRPYPALILDGYWNIIDANDATEVYWQDVHPNSSSRR